MEGMMDTTLKSKNSQKAGNIVKVLREQILTGMLKPGTRIMSARELSRHFQVSQVTANKALLQLVEDKLIVRNERSGSFVKKNWQAKNHTIGFADNLDVFGPEIQASCGLYRIPVSGCCMRTTVLCVFCGRMKFRMRCLSVILTVFWDIMPVGMMN